MSVFRWSEEGEVEYTNGLESVQEGGVEMGEP